MGIPSVIQIGITRNVHYIFWEVILLLTHSSLIIYIWQYFNMFHCTQLFLVPNNSFIMLVNILLFQHYSCQICNLLFSKLCQHNRLRPSADEIVRGAAVQVSSKESKTTVLRHPLKRLYPLEDECQERVTQDENVDSSSNRGCTTYDDPKWGRESSQ